MVRPSGARETSREVFFPSAVWLATCVPGKFRRPAGADFVMANRPGMLSPANFQQSFGLHSATPSGLAGSL
jgi:hypothetical protein